jgi:hypothetical protein
MEKYTRKSQNLKGFFGKTYIYIYIYIFLLGRTINSGVALHYSHATWIVKAGWNEEEEKG